ELQFCTARLQPGTPITGLDGGTLYMAGLRPSRTARDQKFGEAGYEPAAVPITVVDEVLTVNLEPLVDRFGATCSWNLEIPADLTVFDLVDTTGQRRGQLAVLEARYRIEDGR